MAQIVHPDFPGERLLVCLNPRLREERARKREALLEATEEILCGIQASVRRKGSRLRSAVAIARRVGREANRKQVEKHFEITLTESDLTFARRRDRIEAEARLDGLYVVRTNLNAEDLSVEDAVSAYKRLGRVERAFWNLKNGPLEIRPVYVYHPTRVRAHVFLCLLALHVQWHLRRQLAPLLFEDEWPDEVREQGASPVEKARVSESAQRKAAGRKTEQGLPVSSLGTLLGHLSTLTLNEVVIPTQPNRPLTLLAEATPLQRRAFELLNVNPNPGPNVAISGTP